MKLLNIIWGVFKLWNISWYPGFNLVRKDYGFTYRYRLVPVKHCEDKPAIEYPNGTKCWFLHGKRHRVDGPAIEYPSGNGIFFIKDKEMSEKEYLSRDKSKDSFRPEEEVY